MEKSGVRRILIIAGSVSLFVSYLGIWVRMISDPVERTGADFIHFYSAGRIAQSQGAPYVYDLSLQQKVQEEQVGFSLVPGQVLPYNHIPYLIPILRTIATTSYIDSFYRWDSIMLLLYIGGVIILSGLLKQSSLNRGSIVISAIGSILFLPVFVSLLNGQDTAFLFVGAAIWMYGLVSGKEFLAGAGLSLTTVRPHIALILALPMLFRHRKVFLAFALSAGGLALLSVLILGMNGVQDFIDVLLITAGGEWYGTKQFAMFNLIGLLTRTFPWLEADTIRTFGWTIYGMMTIFLCIFWARTKDLKTGRIGLTVILALFSVPHLHFHDLTLLLIPIYDLVRLSKQDSHLKTSIATTLPVAISLILLLSNVSPFLQYSVPYFIMLALAIWPLYAKRQSALIAQSQS
ncbi:MAG TPA: glycosyltransferase family 87 protein [Anaerolineales bacterium]|nr:glycosyltransferase family 87 protein [Anaerolineales bacterium]